MQIGADQIALIKNSNKDFFTAIINPKFLTCSVCFSLNINPKECINKKCRKLFCELCVGKVIGDVLENFTKIQKLCPFCRIGDDYRNADASEVEIISELKLFCNFLECSSVYSIIEYKEHIKSHFTSRQIFESFYICPKCQEKPSMPLVKCGLCSTPSCLTNSRKCKANLRRCFNCKIFICETCLVFKFPEILQNEILCGLCDTDCKKCSKEANTVCGICSSNICRNCSVICSDCNLNICFEKCYPDTTLSQSTLNRCLHQEIINNNKCTTLNCMIFTSTRCRICKSSVCISNCSHKCKTCKESVCKKCLKFCSICKNYNCSICLSNCEKCNSDFLTCNDCDSDVIRKCKICSISLCLNCMSVCNFCNLILCNSHSTCCLDCQENFCGDHFHVCKKCSDPEIKKVCFNCTNKCSFCDITTNSLCKEINHKENLVKVLNCGHKVCKNCLKGCGLCGEVVVSCPKCIVNYYFTFCSTCNIYLCSKCSRYCKNCEDVYCNRTHACSVCSCQYMGCLDCYFNKAGWKLKLKDSNKCNMCKNKFFCSEICEDGFNLKSNVNGIHSCLDFNKDTMVVNELFKKDFKMQIDVQNNGGKQNILNFHAKEKEFQKNAKKIKYENNENQDIYNQKEINNKTEKVKAGCSNSCCLIF
jgi:hypothetical protein